MYSVTSYSQSSLLEFNLFEVTLYSKLLFLLLSLLSFLLPSPSSFLLPSLSPSHHYYHYHPTITFTITIHYFLFFIFLYVFRKVIKLKFFLCFIKKNCLCFTLCVSRFNHYFLIDRFLLLIKLNKLLHLISSTDTICTKSLYLGLFFIHFGVSVKN
jgi:hypothetical protein